ncbi:hypothetical protein B484DRAFT_331400, partial [Ochromonadaceae sp. CCMP2298]
SSLSWFVCAYLQRGVVFDQIYGWEKNLLEPDAFWALVPQCLVSVYHFLNKGITTGRMDGQAPLRIVQQLAREQDFVSFKLDIDTTSVGKP